MRNDGFQPNSLDTNRSAECVWMEAGVVGYKLCDRQFDCEHCPFDLAIRDGGHLADAKPPQGEVFNRRPPMAADRMERTEGSPLFDCDIAGSVFYHPGHVWARIEDEGCVRIGLDDFGQQMVGRIYSVELPAPGTPAQAGRACWRISHQAGETMLVAPVPGTIQETNPKLLDHPSLVNRDPYGDGWAFIIQPTNLGQSLKPLYYGERAAHWFAASIEQLHREVSGLLGASTPDIGATMTDGGLAVIDLHLLLDAGQLQKLIKSFLSNPAHCQRVSDAGKGR